MKNKYSKFYNKYHKKDLHPIVDIMQRHRVQSIKKLLPESGKILIAGCGSGYDMSIVKSKMDGYGIDISKQAIKKSMQKYPRFNYKFGSITKIPFKDNLFDIIVCSEVIEHVPNRKKAFSEMKRVLKSGGILIITTPNWWSWFGITRLIAETLFKKSFSSGNQLVDNWSTPKSLKKEMVDSGFNLAVFQGLWYYPPFGRGQKQLPITLISPFINLTGKINSKLGISLPWFGHMLMVKCIT